MPAILGLFMIIAVGLLSGCIDPPKAPYVDVHDLVTLIDDSRLSTEQGSAEEQYRLGTKYESLVRDYPEAVKWYRMAALQRHPEAIYRLCSLSDQGRGILQDYQEAMSWCRVAADHGYSEAMLLLGIYFEKGRGIRSDRVQAYRWYNLAAANGLEEGVRKRNRLALLMTTKQLAQAQIESRNWKAKYQDTDL
jgi:TPR repeat protein